MLERKKYQMNIHLGVTLVLRRNRGCLHGGGKILEDEITFRLVYMQKFLSRWNWRMKARWRARTTNM